MQHGKTEFHLTLPKFLEELSKVSVSSASTVVSPMPGICDKVLVKVGDHVKANQTVAVIIAMKMEYQLKAPRDGIVKSAVTAGKNVAKDQVVIAFEEEEQAETK